MIAVERLTKVFGRTLAVDQVTFSVKEGEIVGLLGPNGSGKTTIMRVLTGFFPPTAGKAYIGGINVQEDSLAARQMVGYLPENVNLYPDLTVERFLAFCAAVKGVERGRRRGQVEEALRACGLVEVSERLIGKLSKGYRQRVGIAQAILHKPRVLILDEPTVGLDPQQVVEIRQLIKRLAGETTILLSTHILPEVNITCSRVIIIDSGRVIAEDTSENLSRRLEGVDRTLVRIHGPREAVLEGLRGLPGVDRVEEAQTKEAGEVAVTIYAGEGETLRMEVADLAVNSGWSLVEMTPVAMSLEDLFVRLVEAERDQGMAGSGGEAR